MKSFLLDILLASGLISALFAMCFFAAFITYADGEYLLWEGGCLAWIFISYEIHKRLTK